MSDPKQDVNFPPGPEARDRGDSNASISRRAVCTSFHDLLIIPETAEGYLAEAKREIRASALRRLEALEEVHRKLVEQAQAIVQAARRDLLLHDLPVFAHKIRGQSYHLYERNDRNPPRFFSILPPQEYVKADPRAHYRASYRLNEDNSWTCLTEGIEESWFEAASQST